MGHLTQNVVFTVKRRVLNTEHSFHKYHSFTNYDFISTAISFLWNHWGSDNAIYFCTGHYIMSCHDIVYLRGHDVTLQNQFFLMGISTVLLWGVSSEGQCMVGGLEGNLTSWGWEVCFSLGSITLRTFIKVSFSQIIHLWNGMKKYTFEKKISKNFLAQGSANILHKGPDNKYFQFSGSGLPENTHRMIHRWMDEAVFQ